MILNLFYFVSWDKSCNKQAHRLLDLDCPLLMCKVI